MNEVNTPGEQSFRATRMTRRVKQLSDLGDLTKIGQGGQGVVYRAPRVKTNFSASLVYKQYRLGDRAPVDFEALTAMPALVEKSLSYAEGERLISLAAWPCEIVEDEGAPTGFLMPEIPDRFFTSLTTIKGTSRNRAEFQHLLNDKAVLAARGIKIDDVQRYRLLREVASSLSFLHSHGVTVGDISPNNLLFSLDSGESVYFIDCDSMCINGVSALPQVETPGWEAPRGEDLATIYSDAYKLGLLALRLLAGDQGATRPDDLPPTTPSMMRRIIADTLRTEPHQRPLAEVWTYQLGYAIEEAQHRLASEPVEPQPIPASNVLPPPPPPKLPTEAAISTAVTPPPTAQSPASGADTSMDKRFGWATLAAIVAVFGVIIAIVSGRSDSGSTASETSTAASASSKADDSIASSSNTLTAPTEGPTSLAPQPTSATQSAEQPHWDGSWLRNYWEDPQDCNANVGGLDYWVVQSGDNGDMYALKRGCFPRSWSDQITKHCQSLTLPQGKCAVWDTDRIMSSFGKHGDLAIIAITQACLDRAGLTEFHEGPLHPDCVVSPRG